MPTNCPTCAGKGKIENREFENRDRFMHRRFEDEIMRYIRSNHIFRRESCILCVEGHIGEAHEYYKELLKYQNSGTPSGEARIDWELAHLSVIGSLRLAKEEAEEYTELYEMLIATERSYRYDHIEPNWRLIAAEILKVKDGNPAS